MAGSNPAMIVRVAATIEELKRNLAEGKSQIETTTAAMSKLAASFSGDKLIQAAHNVTAAVDSIGGASKLTEAEMARVNRTIEAALEKYRALGKEAPAGMQQLADATKGAADAGETWSSALGKANSLLGLVGLGISVSAFVSFAKGIFDSADALTKLHDRTGISIEGLQQMRAAGDDAGVSLETMGSAVNRLQTQLGTGNAAANGALRDLHINLQDFLKLDAAGQFIAISDAMRQVKDPLEFARIGSELFGKSWAELAPVIKRGFDDVKDSSTGMSTQTVKALDDAGDAAGRWWQIVKDNFGEAFADIITGTVSETRRLASEFDKMVEAADKAAPRLKGMLPPGLPADLDEINRKFDEDAKIINERMTPAAIAFRNAMEELDSVGVGFRGTLDGIDGEVVEAIKYFLDAGVAQGTLAIAYGLTATQIKAVSTALSEEVAMHKLVIDITKTYEKNQDDLNAKAGKAFSDRIVAEQKKKEAAEAANAAFLKGALDDALAQDQLNGILGQMPPTIARGAEAFQGATREAGVFMQQLTMLVSDPRTAGFFGSGAQGAVAATLFGGGASGLTPEMAAAIAAGQFINTAGVGSVQRRQGGSHVSAGTPYLVGERRPELFVPDRAGTIIPSAGGTVLNLSVHINGSLLSDEHKIARAFGDAAINLLRSQGLRLPSGA